MTTYVAVGNNVRNAVAAARKVGATGKAKIRSGGEDGLYRVTLTSNDVVECTIVPHSMCSAMERSEEPCAEHQS